MTSVKNNFFVDLSQLWKKVLKGHLKNNAWKVKQGLTNQISACYHHQVEIEIAGIHDWVGEQF